MSQELICITYDTRTTGIVVQDKSGVSIDVDISVRIKRGLKAAGLQPVYEAWPMQLYRAIDNRTTDELIDVNSLGEGYLQFAQNEAELLLNQYKAEMDDLEPRGEHYNKWEPEALEER